MIREIEDLKLKYETCYDEVSRMKDEIIRYEFSKGGDVFFRGMYTPYLTFERKMFSNYQGRFIKNTQNFTFKYGFDKNDKLIYVLRNLDGFYFEEYILHNVDHEIGLCYSKNKHYLSEVNVCKFHNNLLKSVCHAHIMEWLENRYSFDITEELYTYDDNGLFSIENITGETRYPTRYHSLYEFEKNTFILKNQWISK